jgi:hypothetical protein
MTVLLALGAAASLIAGRAKDARWSQGSALLLDTVTITLRTDSSEAHWELRGAQVTSRSWWEGQELVFGLRSHEATSARRKWFDTR